MVLEDSGRVAGGGGGIRTPEGLAPLPDFKSGGFNHSPTPPETEGSIAENRCGELKSEVGAGAGAGLCSGTSSGARREAPATSGTLRTLRISIEAYRLSRFNEGQELHGAYGIGSIS